MNKFIELCFGILIIQEELIQGKKISAMFLKVIWRYRYMKMLIIFMLQWETTFILISLMALTILF